MNLLPSVNDIHHVTASFDMLLQVFRFWSLTSYLTITVELTSLGLLLFAPLHCVTVLIANKRNSSVFVKNSPLKQQKKFA